MEFLRKLFYRRTPATVFLATQFPTLSPTRFEEFSHNLILAWSYPTLNILSAFLRNRTPVVLLHEKMFIINKRHIAIKVSARLNVNSFSLLFCQVAEQNLLSLFQFSICLREKVTIKYILMVLSNQRKQIVFYYF